MQWYEILSLVGFPSICSACIVALINYLINNNKKRVDKKKKENDDATREIVQEELKELKSQIMKITTSIKYIIDKYDQLGANVQEALNKVEELNTKFETINNKQTDLEKALQTEIRHDIREACMRCIQRGCRTQDDILEITQLHDEYEKLGPNGYTNDLYEIWKNLPVVTKEQLEELLKPEKEKTTTSK